MTGIIIGSIFFVTRLMGGAQISEALYIGGSIIFAWNLIIFAGAVGSMLWVSLQKGKEQSAIASGSALSLLMSLFGVAGIAYLRQGRAGLWFSGSILVLAGSAAVSWISGGIIHPAGALLAAAAIVGGQYFRKLHRISAEGLHGSTPGAAHRFTGDINSYPGQAQGTPDMRHVGGKSIEPEESDKP